MSQKAIDIIRKLEDENPHKTYVMSPELDSEIGSSVIFDTRTNEILYYRKEKI